MRTDGYGKKVRMHLKAGNISILIVGGICHVGGELRM